MLRYIPLIVALAIGPAFAADLAAKKPTHSMDKSTTETTTETIDKSTDMNKGVVDKSPAPTELHVASKLEKKMNALMAKKDVLDKKIGVLQEKIDAEHSAPEKMGK
jgi:hypothetical protein